MFKNDKRLLLYLIEKEILVIDDKIANLMKKGKYKIYNYPQYFNLDKKEEYNIEKCRIGENDSYVCELIRNDIIDEFIAYINRKSIAIESSTIKPSIYETNEFLLKRKNHTLIEYASFYGSIQIFNYLKSNGAALTPSLWNYSIHSNNAELIQILEDNKIQPPISYTKCLKEAIKCHHNEIAEYILNNYIKDQSNIYLYALKYYNYKFYPFEIVINLESFVYACKYGHLYLAEYFFNNKNIHNIDVNGSIRCSYKSKEIDDDDERINSHDEDETASDDDDKGVSDDEDDEKLSIDWTNWNRWSKQSREIDRRRIRKHWKSQYCEEKISALHFAVENEDIEIIKLLLNQQEMNVNKILTRYYKIPQSGYRDKLDTKREEKTALHLAVEKRNLEIVKLLCSNPEININAKTMDCYPSDDDTREMKTPIHIAIENNDIDIVQFLSSYSKIDINLKSIYERWWNGGKEEYEEKAPLNLAAETGNLDIFKILLSKPNIDVNIELIEFYTTSNLSYVYKRKETSFLIAINKRHYDIVELLLSNKSNDAKALSIKEYRFYQYERKKQFKTPLFLAVEKKDKKMVELLLSSEQIDIKNGIIDIGGGSNLSGRRYIGVYNPGQRNDKNKPKMAINRSGLDYLNKRKDNCTTNGTFSHHKKRENTQRYLDMTEEEDTDDDFYFKYKVFRRMTPLEESKIIKNNEIYQILEKISHETKYNTLKNKLEEEEEEYDEFEASD